MNIKGFHVELTNMCTLKCSACARTTFIEQWPQHWKNKNLELQTLSEFLDIDLENISINLCGNYGDPIYHPQILDFVSFFKQKGAIVSITTNGSYKTEQWWKDLVCLLDSRDQVMFSVDGTPDNFTKYRKNGDWDSICTGMKVVADSLCHSVWKYIVFNFNENNVSEVEQLSKQIGLNEFRLEYSDRFHDNDDLIPVNTEFLGLRYEQQKRFQNDEYIKVSPKCSKNHSEHFITADGFYSPCCYIADHRFYYKTQFGKNKKSYDIRVHTVSGIMQKQEVIDFYNNLDNIPACQFNCPKN